MKKITLLLALGFSLSLAKAQVQGLQGVIVEKYYYTTADDSTNAADNEATTVLHKGSTTYRVYIDMAPGFQFIQMFGNSDALDNVLHPLIFKTTTDFFNDPNNGQVYPNANSVINTRKNLTMIDSWLSVGAGCAGKMGITKTEDPDGSIGNANGVLTNSLGANFMGGIYGAPINSVIPSAADGLMPGSPITPNVLGMGSSADVFDQTPGGLFTCTNCAVSALGGAVGTTTSNLILIGQFTTNGIFSFSLNIQLSDTLTNQAQVFVPTNPDLATGEIVFPGLMYTSPTNTTAPPTNTTDTGVGSNTNEITSLSIYPNPSKGFLIVAANNLKDGAANHYSIYDVTGRLMLEKQLQNATSFSETIDISEFKSGLYFVEVSSGNSVSRRKIVKD